MADFINVWVPALRRGAPSNASGMRGAFEPYATRAQALKHEHWSNQAPWASARRLVVSDDTRDGDAVCAAIEDDAELLGGPAIVDAARLVRAGRRAEGVRAYLRALGRLPATTTTLTVSRRSRSLGYGWTNSVEQVPTPNGGYLRVEDVTEPHVTGSLKAVEREHERACRINSGNDWRCALFVGGRRVLQNDGQTSSQFVGGMLWRIRDEGALEVTVTTEEV